MSYDRSIDRNRRAAKAWRSFGTEDIRRGVFLFDLRHSGIQVTDSEEEFLNRFLRGAQWEWTDALRFVCDKMRKEYGGRL